MTWPGSTADLDRFRSVDLAGIWTGSGSDLARIWPEPGPNLASRARDARDGSGQVGSRFGPDRFGPALACSGVVGEGLLGAGRYGNGPVVLSLRSLLDASLLGRARPRPEGQIDGGTP